MLLNDVPGGGRWEAPSGGQPSSSAVGATPRLPAIVGKLTLMLHVSVGLVSLSIAFLLFDSSLFAWVSLQPEGLHSSPYPRQAP